MKAVLPSISLVILFCFSFSVALQQHLYLPMFLLPISLAILNKNEIKSVLKKLVFLNIFILIIAITLIFETKPDTALLIFVRSNLIVLTALLLFCAKNEFDIALGLQQLKFPKKLIAVIFFTAKYIFLIKHEFTLFKKTLHIRGFEPKTDFFSYRVLAGFVGILVLKAYERAKNLQKVMILRNFRGEIYALNQRQNLSAYDAIFCIITFISLLHWRVII